MSIQPVNKAVEHLIHSTPVLEKRERHRQTDGQRQRDGDTKKKKKKKKKWKNERKKERSDYTTLSSRGTIRFKQLRLKMLSGLASNSATSARKQNHVKKGQLVVKHSKCSAVCFVEKKKNVTAHAEHWLVFQQFLHTHKMKGTEWNCCPTIINLMVSVDVKHPVYLLTGIVLFFC